MSRFYRYFWWLLGAMIFSRVVPMLLLPFTDPTEARYAEIARIMAETGDWITPYFDYGVPFWGKPPLAFWAQALSFKIFGINEFAPRLPSWLVTITILGLIYRAICVAMDRSTALLACAIFFSCLLTYALSGAVLTDPYLTLSVTLSLIAFQLVVNKQPGLWGYGFFVGLAIGLLSKGPIAVVLIFGPIGLWLLLDRKRWQVLKLLPWVTGIVVTLLLSLPWYIAAELKTPGFLEYFIVGEHFYRFVDPGWNGDLYGSAHKHMKGFIWVLWLAASFPWGVIAVIAVIRRLTRASTRQQLLQLLRDDDIGLYILWALFTPCFFSIAGNVLWTYLLPSLPALAIGMAYYFNVTLKNMKHCHIRRLSLAMLISPLLLLVASVYVDTHHEIAPTEKYLVERYKSISTPADKLLFVNEVPFSARYYLQGKSNIIGIDKLKHAMSEYSNVDLYLAVPKQTIAKVKQLADRPASILYSSYDFVLLKINSTIEQTVPKDKM